MPMGISMHWLNILAKPTSCTGLGLTGADLATTIGANAVQNASNAVAKDCGNGNVGSFAFLFTGWPIAPGTTYAGSGLNSSSANLNGVGTMSGTWRALGSMLVGLDATLFQRIA